jgi:hypothetical protein
MGYPVAESDARDAFSSAASAGHTSIVLLLLEWGATKFNYGTQADAAGLTNDDIYAVQLLLEAWAPSNSSSSREFMGPPWCFTPLKGFCQSLDAWVPQLVYPNYVGISTFAVRYGLDTQPSHGCWNTVTSTQAAE